MKNRVIVVNDDPIQGGILSGLLNKEGLDVSEYRGAEDALGKMDANLPPDLIVTDLYMPEMDGWRFCRLLRSPEYADFNRIPILVVSATFSGEDARLITKDLGANGFLPAPVEGARFLDQVRSLLAGKTPASSTRVLIVEDSRSTSKLLRRAFAGHGYDVSAAMTGADARRAFMENAFEIVLLDYHLPDVHGDELLRDFRKQRAECVFIMMTADNSPEVAVACMREGAGAYVRKPFDPEYLVDVCERVRRERCLLHVEEILEKRTQDLRASEARLSLALAERKRAEEQRLDLERRVQQSQKLESLGVMAGGIAHHFNNLLMAVLTNLEMARYELDAEPGDFSPPNLLNNIGNAEKAAEKAAGLSRSILTYVGQAKREKRIIDLSEYVREMAPLIRSTMPEGSTLDINLPPNNSWVEADPNQVRQVIENLVTNGRESLGKQEGRIRISVATLRLSMEGPESMLQKEGLPAGEYVVLEVSDTGGGMDSRTLERAPEPFFSTKFVGRGLGLPVVLGIMKAHGGALTISSEAARGTTAKVFFPSAQDPNPIP